MTRSPSSSAVPPGPYFVDVPLVPLRRRLDVLLLALVLLAIAGDISAFYVVLARLFLGQPVVIAVASLGFAAVAVGLTHLIGCSQRRRRAGDRARSDGLLLLWTAAWVLLGVAAFAGRIYFGPVVAISGFGSTATAADSLRDLLAACVFAGLYLGSGALAIGVSYLTYNPAFRAYQRAGKNLHAAQARVQASEAALAGLEQQSSDLHTELATAPLRREISRVTTHNDIVALTIAARHQMAATIPDDDGQVLALFMLDARTPLDYPHTERTGP